MNQEWINSKGRLKAAWLCAAVALSVAVAGCVAPAVDTTPRVAPSFDYTPTQQAEPMSANITFAVVGTETIWGSKQRPNQFETPPPLFERFSSSMAGDFAEILTARGYSIRGPFRTYDEMTFPDKEGSNLVLTATVDIAYDTSQIKPVAVGSGIGVVDAIDALLGTDTSSDSRFRIEGTVHVEGRMTLIVAESITYEKMWTKSVDIQSIDVSFKGTQVYQSTAPDLAGVLEHENQFYTDLGRALEGQYVEIMERTHAYLDPREMALLDRQADSLRERKRY